MVSLKEVISLTQIVMSIYLINHGKHIGGGLVILRPMHRMINTEKGMNK